MSARENKILVAMDFSAESERAFNEALMLAKGLNAPIEVVHAADLPAWAFERAEAADGPLGQARAALAEHRKRAEKAGLECKTHVIVGPVVPGLLDMVEELAPTMVVVGSRGRGPARQLFFGSVSEALVRKGNVPVLVISAAAPQRTTAANTAWSCVACGHILGDFESSDRCEGCSAWPARWQSAHVEAGPVDAAEPAVGDEAPAPHMGAESRTAGFVATAPAGAEGYDVNPELKVRY